MMDGITDKLDEVTDKLKIVKRQIILNVLMRTLFGIIAIRAFFEYGFLSVEFLGVAILAEIVDFKYDFNF